MIFILLNTQGEVWTEWQHYLSVTIYFSRVETDAVKVNGDWDC